MGGEKLNSPDFAQKHSQLTQENTAVCFLRGFLQNICEDGTL